MIPLAELDGVEALGAGGGAVAVATAVLVPVVRNLLHARKEDRDRRDAARKAEREAFLAALTEQTKQFAASLREEREALLDERKEDRRQLAELASVVRELAIEVRCMRNGGPRMPLSADGVPGGVS